MSAPVLTTNPHLRLAPEPLTPENFSPYGTAITSPLPRDLSTAPALSSLPPHTPAPVLANQNSALKYSPISPLDDNYNGNCPSRKPSAGRMTMFSCFPRKLRPAGASRRGIFDVRILERHPFTSQTFSPLDLSAHSTAGGEDEPFFLVIVAPTLKGQTATATTVNSAGGKESVTVRDPPDLRNLKAFTARGGQAVTYGAGTWHAPMVVVGQRRVDFVVVQFMNGVGDEDCQEAAFGEGVEVEVDLGARNNVARL